MKFNEITGKWQDRETGFDSYSKTGLLTKIKRFKLNIPYSIFLSNRFVLNNIEYGEEALV